MAIKADYQQRHPKAQYYGEADGEYNCHAYAWHMSEGGGKIWINRNLVTGYPSVYWEDGSFVATTSGDSYATKVSYHSDDHSAITTVVPGYFISKWGPTCLWRHRYDDCPYNASDLRYYKLNVKILGDQSVRIPVASVSETVNYYLSDAPSNISVEWTAIGATIVGGQGTRQVQVSLTKDATIEAVIHNDKGTRTKVPSLNVLADKGPIITDIEMFRYGGETRGEYTLKVVSNQPDATFVWSVDGGYAQLSEIPYPGDATFIQEPNTFKYITFHENRYYTISVYGTTGSYWGRIYSKTFDITTAE